MQPFSALALEAAQAGVRAIEGVSRGPGLEIGTKTSLRDLVTTADHAAERAILDMIRAHRPDDAIVAEESGEHPGTSGVRWFVDPVDGTMNYVHGRHDHGVAVGVERAGRVVAGAIVRPAYGDWWAADGDEPYGSNGTPAVSGEQSLPDALVCIGFPQPPRLRQRFLALVGDLMPHIRDFRRIGCASSDLVSVATGAADAHIAVDVKPWDRVAGEAIVVAAGGRCLDVTTAGGLAVFIAATPVIADALEALLRRSGR
ncbi:MAG: inositol monophosphatase family protein [Streptomycetales bacterium]